MNQDQAITAIVNKLEKDKYFFLNTIETKINDFIKKQGKGCLTIIERNKDGGNYKKWELKASHNYLKRLIKFCNNKKINGRVLDSGLTDPIIDIIAKEYATFYSKKSDEISEVLLKVILEDRQMSRSLIQTIIEGNSSQKIKGKILDKCTDLLLSQMNEVVNNMAFSSLKSSTIQAISGTSAKVIAHKVVLLIGKTLSLNLKVIIAKVLAAPIVKKLIAMAVKKFVIAALIAALVKLIGFKLGISASATALVIVLPILAVWIVHDIKKFPEKLGKKVSSAIRKNLDADYKTINMDITQKVLDEVISMGAKKIGKMIINDPKSALGKEIDELIKKL